MSDLLPIRATVDDRTFLSGEGDWWIDEAGVDGWYDSPVVRLDTADIPGQDGSFTPDEPLLSGREISFTGYHRASSMAVAKLDVQRWAAALAKRHGFDFTVEDEAGRLSSQVWVRGQVRMKPVLDLWLRFNFVLFAPDPRKYGPLPTPPLTLSATPEVTDGLQFPLFGDGFLSFGDFGDGAGFGAGQFALLNRGSIASWPVYRVTGALTSGFSILTDGGELKYAATVPAGAELVLSPYAGGRAVLDGVDVTTNLTVANWVPVGPGERRLFTFVPAGAVSAGAGIRVDFREAWI